jgi:hypothetical protein
MRLSKSNFINYLISKLAYSKFIIVFLPSFYTTTTQTTTESNEIYFFAGGVTSSLGKESSQHLW